MKIRPTVKIVSKESQRSDEQWVVILDQDGFHWAPTIPLGIYSGVPPTTLYFHSVQIYRYDLQNKSLYDRFSLDMGRSFLRGKRPNPEAMRRLRRRESIHSIVQVCTKPNAADDTQ